LTTWATVWFMELVPNTWTLPHFECVMRSGAPVRCYVDRGSPPALTHSIMALRYHFIWRCIIRWSRTQESLTVYPRPSSRGFIFIYLSVSFHLHKRLVQVWSMEAGARGSPHHQVVALCRGKVRFVLQCVVCQHHKLHKTKKTSNVKIILMRKNLGKRILEVFCEISGSHDGEYEV
jgi:hypothetical protein